MCWQRCPQLPTRGFCAVERVGVAVRGRAASIGVVAVIAAGAVAIATSATNSNGDRRIHVEQEPTRTQPASPTLPTTEVTFRVSPAKPVDVTAPEPSHFFADIGAGEERTRSWTLPPANTASTSDSTQPDTRPVQRRLEDDLPTRHRWLWAWCGPRLMSRPRNSSRVSKPRHAERRRSKAPTATRSHTYDHSATLISPDTSPMNLSSANKTTGTGAILDRTARRRPRHDHAAQLVTGLRACQLPVQQGPGSSARILDVNHGTGAYRRSPTPQSEPRLPHRGTAFFRPGTNLVVAAETAWAWSSSQLIDYDARFPARASAPPSPLPRCARSSARRRSFR